MIKKVGDEKMSRFDFTKEYGVVLEGGGAKGAYQIGVWKAMQECGIKIKGISGVSVGALNGALMCMGDLKKAESIWENISYSQVMQVDDEQMNYLMNLNLKQLDLKLLSKTVIKVLTDGGLNIAPLKQLIDECVDEEKIINSPIELLLGTFLVTGFKELEIPVKAENEEYLKDYLLASAYFPAFKNEKLHGKKYMDGGIINNVPVDRLIKRGYKHIIVVRIYGIGLEKRIKIPEDVEIIQIAPRVELGNLLDFDSKKSIRNMKIGYYDGLRVFRSLKGFIYYIESTLSEEECIRRFVQSNEYAQMAFLEYYHLDYSDPSMYLRNLLEKVLPLIAEELKLSKRWSYEELYLSMIELCAKNVRVQKYKVYMVEELIVKIREKYKMLKVRDKNFRLPLFIDLVMNLVVTPNE